MNYIILAFAAVMLILGVIILVKPMLVFDLLKTHSQSLKLYIVAIVVRVLLGIALILSAQSSKFPLTFEIIGWISIAAAIILLLICHKNFKKLLAWATSLAPMYGRVGGVFVILFGAFIGYAVF